MPGKPITSKSKKQAKRKKPAARVAAREIPHDESLALDYAEARSKLRSAADTLHDQVGSSLVAAGLQLQMLRMDHPVLEAPIAEIAAVLETTMSAVRSVSLELAPSPVRALGLEGSLEELLERHQAEAGIPIVLRYKAVAIPASLGDSIYHTVELFLCALLPAAGHVSISVGGTTSDSGLYTLRIRSACRNPLAKRHSSPLKKAILFAKTCCLSFTIEPGQVTMITMHYAHQRPVS